MLKLSTILLLVLPTLTTCFAVSQQQYSAKTTLFMAPRFDKQEKKWYPTSPEEEASAGYGIWGSLLRQGPTPFLQRLFQADDYEQGKL